MTAHSDWLYRRACSHTVLRVVSFALFSGWYCDECGSFRAEAAIPDSALNRGTTRFAIGAGLALLLFIVIVVTHLSLPVVHS